MTDEEIWEMWRESLDVHSMEVDMAFARKIEQAAIKAEREACAKVCTDLWHTLCDRDADIGELSVAGDCAHLIRTRGDPPPPVDSP